MTIPSDYTSRPAGNGKGTVYQAPGAAGNADMIRVMDPTTRYPDGYVRIYNKHGQPVNINGGVKGTATATQVGSISGSFQNGLAVVDVKTDSANPMVSGAPAINTDLRIVATSTGEFAVGGSIDGFPSASLTVTNERGQTFTVFDFDPRSVGNGPFSLMPGVGDQQINVACTSDGTCDRSQ